MKAEFIQTIAYMLKTYLLFTICYFQVVCHAQKKEKAKMFRDNPWHNASHVSFPDLIYDTKTWSFFAGAPVRSTPLTNGNAIFFGTTRGDFYAVHKSSGKLGWRFNTGFPINSSAAAQDGRVFFADNSQTVYALKESSGQLLWKFDLDEKQAYPWRFDYFYSSPTLYDNKLIIGGDDGFLHMLNQKNGQQLWKFKTKGIIRSSAAVVQNKVVVGDMDGTLYAVDIKDGKEKWNFKVIGDSLNNENFGLRQESNSIKPGY